MCVGGLFVREVRGVTCRKPGDGAAIARPHAKAIDVHRGVAGSPACVVTGASGKVGPPPVNRLAPITMTNQPTIITMAFSESQIKPEFFVKILLMFPRSAKIRSMPLAAGYEQMYRPMSTPTMPSTRYS